MTHPLFQDNEARDADGKAKEIKKICRGSFCQAVFETEDEDEEYCLWCRQDIAIQNEIDSWRGG